MIEIQERLAPVIKLLVFFSVLLTFFVRPLSLGLDFSLLSNGILLVFSIIISSSVQSNLYNKDKNFVVVISLYLIFAIYNSIFRHTINTSFIPVLQVFIVYILFSNYEIMQLFFKYLKSVFLILIILAIFNFALESIFGGRDSLVLIKDIQYCGGTYEFSLFFPLTWSRMGWDLGGSSLLSGVHSRQYFFFLEPGMAPPFFTSFIYLIWNDHSERYKLLQTILFIIGIFLTFSTGGPLILLASVGVWFFSTHRHKLSVFSIVLVLLCVFMAWYVYNYMPFFGRMAKMELSTGTAESIETHENVGGNVIVGVILIIIYGILSFRLKHNKVLPIVIAFNMALGYMSNYVGFTTLSTMFLFWDDSPSFNTCKRKMGTVSTRSSISSNIAEL